MSQDTPNTEPTDISDLYREASREVSPPQLDQAILDLAKQQAEFNRERSLRRQESRRLRRWSSPLAWAAVIALSVSLILQLELESPEQVYPSSDTEITLESSGVSAGRSDQAAPSDDIVSQSLVAGADATDDVKVKTEPKTEEERALPSEQVRSTSVKAKPAMKSRPAPVAATAMPGKKTLQKSESDISTLHDEVRAAMKQSSRSPTDTSIASDTLVEQADAAKPSALSKTPTTPAKPRAFRPAPAPAPPMRAEADTQQNAGLIPESVQAEPMQSEPVQAEAFTAAAIAAERKNRLAPSESSQACAALTQVDCLKTANCTLELRKSELHCRATENACEQDFIQLPANKALCASRSGCRFVQGDCTCDSKNTCRCGAIGPSRCEPEQAKISN